MSAVKPSQVIEEMVIDFKDSRLNLKQRELLRQELLHFKDMFVETSKRPGRTEMIKFQIDTGTTHPIKQQPYRVSKAEADVMEAEIKQYLDLGLIDNQLSRGLAQYS